MRKFFWFNFVLIILIVITSCNSIENNQTNPTSSTKIIYQPYIEPGDTSLFPSKDQMVIAWQTNEKQPKPNAYKVEFGTENQYTSSVIPVGRVVDNYLTASKLPVPKTATGARVNYYAVLKNLNYDINYSYRVTGTGLPQKGFQASFHTRKQDGKFSFQVMGDEGFFPPDPSNKPYLANYEARVVNTMYNVENLSFPNINSLPKPDFALNTGDNVYTTGSEGNYGDYWMPVWNSDIASNELGAPYIRSIPYYIVAGNHDLGGNGDRANLLGDDQAGRYSGNVDGGDALQYFNNYYFPLNGPPGVDLQYIFNADAKTADGFYFKYQGKTYSSPKAIEAFRQSTTVDTGAGEKRQIDHMSNYSFDYGNAHFVFLDANPHLFNALVSSEPIYQKPLVNFPEYPSILRDWLINDLDGSNQTWKIVVFHQPSFSSGNATLRNHQMRRIAKFLEDHGVNLVYNGHEHNYQRTLPLRVLKGVTESPTTEAAVAIDSNFDGQTKTVPDGVVYIVEGAGGDRDFDNNLILPRGLGEGVDQDDSATGNYTYATGITYANGSASWLDTNLTNVQMSSFFANAGKGAKITRHFKSKVFSFGDVVIKDNVLTHYQISEPLQNKSSATPNNPYPYGKDLFGKALSDPIPDTRVNPATGKVITPPAKGTPALLDKFTITKPEVKDTLLVNFVKKDDAINYEVTVTNNSPYPLNGTQVVVTLPVGIRFADQLSSTVTQHHQDIVFTLGRLNVGEKRQVRLQAKVSAISSQLSTQAIVRSSTALPVIATLDSK